MLAKLRLQLDANDINYYKSSNLQGVLMESISPDYAAFLHSQQMHPYSQSVINVDEKTYWTINALNREAYENILLPLNETISEIHLKSNIDKTIAIADKSITTIKRADLLKEFNTVPADRYFKLSFATPTAFKQDGKYLILPDLRCIFQNLMLRYSYISNEIDLFDEDTLDQLTHDSLITGLRISGRRFPMERVYIPGFVGEITVKCTGANTMARFIRLLLRFAEYSGIGIKTAVGMGAVALVDNIGRKSDE